MPGILPAPESLLNAIFAHTNKLNFDDRQMILRFLAGEGSPNSTRRQLMNQNGTQIVRSLSSTVRNQNSSIIQPGGLVQSASEAFVDVENNPVIQILLHEERRNELRPSSSRSINLNGELSPEMKSYTIVDQIIFEMDYSTGCWRKLRRRIRISDRKQNRLQQQNETSSIIPRSISSNANTQLSDMNDDNVVQDDLNVDILDVDTQRFGDNNAQRFGNNNARDANQEPIQVNSVNSQASVNIPLNLQNQLFGEFLTTNESSAQPVETRNSSRRVIRMNSTRGQSANISSVLPHQQSMNQVNNNFQSRYLSRNDGNQSASATLR